MTFIIFCLIIWGVYKALSYGIQSARESKRQEEMERLRREQERQREAIRRENAERKAMEAEQRRQAQEIVRQAREQARQAKEQERQAKEQERQRAILAKHEEQIAKLERRLSSAESELAFNREQRDRLFMLLDIEERERAASIEGSGTWQKHHKKVISLENQIHAVQKRIDKAQADKAYCESKLSA